MKSKKIIFFFFCMFLLTGCTAEANIVVTTTKKTEENIQIYNTWNNLKENHENIESAKEMYALSYQDFFKNTKYKVSYSTKNALLKAIIKNSSNTLNTISNSDIYLTLFEPVMVNENQYTLTLREDAIDLFEDTLGVGADSSLFFDEFVLNIQFHNVVENANSDSYSSRTNTYTWFINKENLTRNLAFTITNEKRYDIIVPYLIKKHFDLILLGAIVLVIIVASLLIIRKAKHENAI